MRAAGSRRAILLLAMLVGASLPAAARAELSARVTLASSYVHRGIEYAGSAPTWQAGLEYRSSGAFAGLWGARIDVDDYTGVDGRDRELDYYIGYGRRLAPGLTLESTLIRYTWHGRSPLNDAWNELQLTAYLGSRWTVTWGVADDWGGWGETTRFLEGTLRHPLPAGLVLDVTAGYQFAERAAGIDYGYAEAGVSAGFEHLVLRVGHTAVQSRARERFAPLADNRWVVSLTLLR
ncbi:MAG TPA: TorF family putative porin [Pseudomonadales bacterium]